MKKGLIGILSSIIILGSGFFISNMNTSNKDIHKNEKTKQEKVIKEEKKKKEDNKDDSKKIEKDKDIVEKTTENSKNANSEEIKTETSKNKKTVETPQAEVKHKVIESTNIEKNITQSDYKNIQKNDETSLEKKITQEKNIPCDNPQSSYSYGGSLADDGYAGDISNVPGTEPSTPGPNIGADLD
ncbi:MAG: hypothetical protein E6538_10940 [Paeniclostridium sordellii]|nr:hypothetical protein [Paeniclostridium sordellii]